MNKKGLSVLGIAAMLSSLDSMADYDPTSNSRGSNTLKPEEINTKPKRKIIPKGCKKYIIDGFEIIAINEKSAIRKFNKINKT